MNSDNPQPQFRRYPPPGNRRRTHRPASFRPFHHNYGHRPPDFPVSSHNHGPQGPSITIKPPNFVVKLLYGSRRLSDADVESLITNCKSKPDHIHPFRNGPVAAVLYFSQWVDTLETIAYFWESRLQGAHDFNLGLTPHVLVPSDVDELHDRLRRIFAEHVKGLINGEQVDRWLQKSKRLAKEIEDLSAFRKKWIRVDDYDVLHAKRKGLEAEKLLIDNRVSEFQSAMECIVWYLEDIRLNESADESVRVVKFDGRFDPTRLYNIIKRERKRLDAGLPIYAYRRDILMQVLNQQITVLVGETGSGKSTQLAQFLADSGIGADNAIVCTQPRKVAARSLTSRVQEESWGCYEDNAIRCYSSFSSSDKFASKIIYMTDHCLLQHCIGDKNMSGISCIIIDEAHERSLNTDILLALLKGLLCKRIDLRLIIMSATADTKQLSDYFFGCGIFHVVGRNFQVDITYVPSVTDRPLGTSATGSYVSDVLRMAVEVHKTEEEGTILAFLTSQAEVEWACEKFEDPSASALPLHGKLSSEEQLRVFQNVPGKRKVIFATNLAETSLTIPGVKYVIDPGIVKASNFEPGSGMNILKVCWISQSSANQRAGRAGRTGPGRCYRLYSESDYESMVPNQEPEIRRVHLGIAVLRILALGVKNVQEFDFVDAPRPKAVEMAIQNLIVLGAVKVNDNICELTGEGHRFVRLGVEPRLGKLILSCFDHGLRKEGLVLAAVMANSSSIFCRVGSEDDKSRADCRKVQFCHPNGDLFTLLSVYKEWEKLPLDKRRNIWCWDNSVNAKAMRRCQETIIELESCLRRELHVVIPSYWVWNPHKPSEHDDYLKKAILSSLRDNVAMYSGYDQLGYEVALLGEHIQLHPSCSLRIFGQKPGWVVFGELLSASKEYLVCVTAFDYDSLNTLNPPPLFNISEMEDQKLQLTVLTGFGNTVLKRFCGKSSNNLFNILSQIRTASMDNRIGIEVDVDQNVVQLYAASQDMEKVFRHVDDVLNYERKWLQNECLEKCLYHGANVSTAIALFGAGAEIKHLELDRHCLSVDVSHSHANAIEDKELVMFIEKNASGSVCAIHKTVGIGQGADDSQRWGRLTFLSPDDAKRALELNGVEFCGSSLKLFPSQTTAAADKSYSFPAVKAKIFWPRRFSNGIAIVRCNTTDVNHMINDLNNLEVGGRSIRCQPSRKFQDSVVISRLDKMTSEAEILDVLRNATTRTILDFFLLRGDAVADQPCKSCEEALLKELLPFIPKANPRSSPCRVQVFSPEPKDAFMRALITFDGSLHLEAAKALEEIEGKVLPGLLPWQKIKCQRLFSSTLTFPSHVYHVIKKELDSLVAGFTALNGTECILEKTVNGLHRVRISANATRRVAEIRRPLEKLARGNTINHDSLTPEILQLLFSRDGIEVMKTLQQEMGTYILFDRHTLQLRVFGSSGAVAMTEQKLIQSLLSLHDKKKLIIHLRGIGLPPDLMKQVVKKFGPDLSGLKEAVPEANFTLDTRWQIISIHGNKELKDRVEEKILEIARASHCWAEKVNTETDCPICLCRVEDGYRLEGCNHLFCRLCLVEQCESSIRGHDSFPICCTQDDCGCPIVLSDLKYLMSNVKLEELFRASLDSFVACSGGKYRFCPSPDCPSIYRVADPGTDDAPFVCGACYAETCTRCHLEYHAYISCERYQEFKKDPDLSLKEWSKGKDVKRCSACGLTIEKIDGCNHVECKCGKHVCWVCLDFFCTSDDCYGHLRNVHRAIYENI